MTTYAVIDVETTGFAADDRIVEIAVVVVDHDTRQVVDEFDTLVEPGRDVGPTRVHGITRSMVEAAPTFADVAGSLSRVLAGSILVAHNLPFDERFVLAEFGRIGVGVDTGAGVCTLRLSGERLDRACQRHGIDLAHHHRALADARATASLLLALRDDTEVEHVVPVSFISRLDPGVPRTLRRDAVVVERSDPETLALRPSRFRVRYPTTDEAAMGYLNIVDAYLDDLVLDDAERSSLAALADLYGLDRSTCERLHRDYLMALIDAALRDGVVSDREVSIMAAVAFALGVTDVELPAASSGSLLQVLEDADPHA